MFTVFSTPYLCSCHCLLSVWMVVLGHGRLCKVNLAVMTL